MLKSPTAHTVSSFMLCVTLPYNGIHQCVVSWSKSYSAVWRSQNVEASLAFAFGQDAPLCLCILYDRHAFVFAGDNVVA